MNLSLVDWFQILIVIMAGLAYLTQNLKHKRLLMFVFLVLFIFSIVLREKGF